MENLTIDHGHMIKWCYNGHDEWIPLVPEGMEFQPADDNMEILEHGLDIIEALARREDFAHPGRRNNDGVNLGIALYALGCPDQTKWLVKLDEQLHMNCDDFMELMSKLQDVDGYLHKWSDHGKDVKKIFAYTI